jgi:hypothetical protein
MVRHWFKGHGERKQEGLKVPPRQPSPHDYGYVLERAMGIDPTTCSLGGWCTKRTRLKHNRL